MYHLVPIVACFIPRAAGAILPSNESVSRAITQDKVGWQAHHHRQSAANETRQPYSGPDATQMDRTEN